MLDPIQASINEYKLVNPDVEISLEGFGGYWDKMPAAISAGTEGDIVYWMARDFLPYFIGGRFASVPEDIMSVEDMEATYWLGSLGLWKHGGKYYGFTDDYNCEGYILLYINRSLLSEHGHEIPADWIANGRPGSWDELLAFAKAITVKRAGHVAIPGLVGANDKWNAQRFFSLIFQAGGEYRDPENRKVHFNTPEAKRALEFMNNWINNEGVDSYELGNGIVQFMQNANAFMAAGAPHWAKKIKKAHPEMDYVILGFPPIFGDKPYWHVDGGWGYAVSSNCANPREAWKFIKFATSYDRQKRIALSAGYIPTRVGMAVDPDIAKAPNVAPMLKITVYGMSTPNYVISQGRLTAEGNIVDEEIENVYMGLKSVEDALKDMEERGNAMIEELWETYGK